MRHAYETSLLETNKGLNALISTTKELGEKNQVELNTNKIRIMYLNACREPTKLNFEEN